MTEIADRLTKVRKKIKDAGVDVLLVRSTDRYLNEYVPEDESSRVWISGFTGSMGEVLIAPDRAYLAVDGRYWLQADKQVDASLYEVIRAPLSTALDDAIIDKLKTLAPAKKNETLKVGFEPERLTPHALANLKSKLGDRFVLVPLHPSPVDAVRGPVKATTGKIRLVDEKRVGRTSSDKLRELGERLTALDVDAMLIQRLDEIAYLSNLRGDEVPYHAIFKAIALATRDKLFIGLDPARVPSSVRVERDGVLFVPEAELWASIGKKAKRTRVAFDPSGNTEQGRLAIEKAGATAVSVESPVGPMKAKKNKAELASMTEAFARADQVVDRAVHFLCGEVVAGRRVTEADFADKVNALFEASGASGLSFRIISAAGKNGAIIHYSDPSPRRVVTRGELMLLDTGAYYEEGYATDLTRTFLVDGPGARGSDEQRRYYTLVLRAAIAGMTAVIPESARGGALDAIVRAPLWAEGLNYNHGTGHGVGINVHEFPPRIGPNSPSPLEEGFVFSIEPGVYLPAFGGIRIENLCTLEKMPRAPGFLRVVPLTYSPLDKRLIEPKLMTPFEKAYLAQYSKVHASAERKRLRTASASTDS
jgi:Xaa-Pro aminopeptidase